MNFLSQCFSPFYNISFKKTKTLLIYYQIFPPNIRLAIFQSNCQFCREFSGRPLEWLVVTEGNVGGHLHWKVPSEILFSGECKGGIPELCLTLVASLDLSWMIPTAMMLTVRSTDIIVPRSNYSQLNWVYLVCALNRAVVLWHHPLERKPTCAEHDLPSAAVLGCSLSGRALFEESHEKKWKPHPWVHPDDLLKAIQEGPWDPHLFGARRRTPLQTHSDQHSQHQAIQGLPQLLLRIV